MFRAAALSIALTLSVGQNAALLCRTWCQAHAAATSECHHEDSSTAQRVASDEGCDRPSLNALVFVREDVRPGAAVGDADYAVSVPRHHLAHSQIDARPGQEPGREWSREHRPLPTALRI